MYEELLAGVEGVKVHSQPTSGEYDSNYWLCTITIDPSVKVKGQEDAYKTIVTGAVGGAAGVIHAASSAVTDCQPNDNVEALRVFMDKAQIEARPVWKPMHKQPCYASAPAYVNGVSEAIFKIGMCLPAGPGPTDRFFDINNDESQPSGWLSVVLIGHVFTQVRCKPITGARPQ